MDRDKRGDPDSELPLTPVSLNVLLALADEDRHGYGIMLKVSERTGGRMRMGPGTLYGSIKRLVEGRLIEESEERPAPESDDERVATPVSRTSGGGFWPRRSGVWSLRYARPKEGCLPRTRTRYGYGVGVMSPGGSHHRGRRRSVEASRRVYRVLMRAYPQEIRVRYGEEMAGFFSDACRDEVRNRGSKGLAAP